MKKVLISIRMKCILINEQKLKIFRRESKYFLYYEILIIKSMIILDI